jgi:hypothetical protein
MNKTSMSHKTNNTSSSGHANTLASTTMNMPRRLRLFHPRSSIVTQISEALMVTG